MRYRNAPAHIRAAINAQADRWTTASGEPLSNVLRQEASEREAITAETVFTITGDSVPPF
jgi:hypothetical protein